MKLLGKGRLQRGMLSAPNASDANFKPLHTHHGCELFPNLPLHEETGSRYKQLRRYYIRASKLIFFKGSGFRKQGETKFKCSKIFCHRHWSGYSTGENGHNYTLHPEQRSREREDEQPYTPSG